MRPWNRLSAPWLAVLALLGFIFLGLGLLAPLADIVGGLGGADFPAEYYHARLLWAERASVYDHDAMLALARAEIGSERLPRNVYPPFYSIVFLGLVPFPYHVARALWVMLNLTALLLSMLGLRRIWEERAGARLPTGYTLAFFLLAGSLFYPTADHQWQGQANLVELCLVTWAFYLHTRRKPATPLAALCYAVAVLLKLYPAIFLPYLLVRRQWRLLAWIGGLAILFIAVSMLIVQPEDYLGYPRLLLESNYVGGAFNLANYSLASWGGGWAGLLGLPAAISGTALLLLRLLPYAAFLWLAWRERAATGLAEAFRFAQGFLLIGFIMSQFWEHHLVLLLFPYFLLGGAYVRATEIAATPEKPTSVGLSRLGLGLTIASALIVAVPFLGNIRWFERFALVPRLIALGAPTDYLVGFKFLGVLLLLVALEIAIRGANLRSSRLAPRGASAPAPAAPG